VTPKQLSDHILFKLGISSSDFSELLTEVNLHKNEIAESITEAYQNYFGTWYITDLVASSGDETKRAYLLPDDVMNNLFKAEAKLDGTNFVELKPRGIVPERHIRFQESWITNHFSNSVNNDDADPCYFIFGNKIYILSGEITDVTNGLRIWYIKYPDDLPDLTEATLDMSASTSIQLPRQFHELLARRVIIGFKEANNLPLVGRESLFDQDLEKKIKLLAGMNLDDEIIASRPLELESGEDL